jgi:hypothetical protein
MATLLDEWKAAKDESLRCPVCGSEGYTPCSLSLHIATLAGFAASNARAWRIFNAQRVAWLPMDDDDDKGDDK